MIKYCLLLIICVCIFTISDFKKTQPSDICTCYAHLGCINITRDWFKSCRPVNLRPQPRHVINTKFLFLSPCEEDAIIVYDIITFNPDSVNITKFSSNNKLLFLIHDFTSSGYTGWIKHLTLVLFKKGDYNVIAVDWQSGAEAPIEQAVANARLVALEVVAIIRMFQQHFNMKLKQIHLIGHGVGAHIAGYAGKEMNGKIGRITGLDPTGPQFECLDNRGKLSHTDASYVDVIHTDAKGYYRQGTLDTMGHTDYYFNDGHDQPGCVVNKHYHPISKLRPCELTKGTVLPGCSHKRAFKYFIEALTTNQCQFIGFKADSYSDFLKSRGVDCNDNCATLGLNIMKPRSVKQRYFLETQARPPFCMNPYLVTLNLGCTDDVEAVIHGHVDLFMVEEGTNMQVNVTVNKYHMRNIAHGKNETFIAYGNSYGVDKISELKVRWTHIPRPFCIGCNNDMYMNNITISHIKSDITDYAEIYNDFCPHSSNGTLLKSGCPQVFKKCCKIEDPLHFLQ